MEQTTSINLPTKPVFLQNKMVPLLIIVSSLFLSLLLYFALKPKSQKHKLPPSPTKLPIIGNLHQLGSFPHRSLRALSMKYGSVMFLYIGSSPILVVSSEEAAQDIMKTHDLVFSDRPSSIISDELFYRGKDVAFAPYGEYWRQVRKISVLHLLSTKRVESFRAVREKEVARMLEKISQASGPINLSKLIISTTNNTMSRIALGKYYEGKLSGGIDFHQLLAEFLILLGTIHIGDIFPSLAWIGRLTGLDARLKKNFQQWDDFLEQVIQDHNEKRNNTSEHGPQDLVDILLEVQRDGSIGIPLHKDHIKAVILDNFAAGTDTTYTTIVWALAELIRHPTAMKKAQEEIRRIIHGNSIVSEDDIGKMSYLKCVIKEALRLHPPLPLLVQRKSRQDIEVKGFHIPAKTQVMVNAWAIARDPKSWTDPESFLPERFINSEVDFRGQYMKLIPFGAGRRGCPGIPFAIATVELVLANLLHGFDWELPGEALDMSEVFGITVHKKSPLVLVPRPHYTK
ncbi:cytochrome P450 71A1-like [Aristolochia californica]|uniref:cytochrome P450 71A1-like n=1 Tax=Aristolochia californica TaxID=171875 RepID=UPI0035DD5972